MSKLAGMLGLAAAAAAVLAYDRAKRIAEDENRPLGEVLAEMPGKLFADLRTIPDDLREAAEEGKSAAAAAVTGDRRRDQRPARGRVVTGLASA